MGALEDIGLFTTVDEAEDPRQFIELLDRMQGTADVRAARADALARLGIGPGYRVLDLGCGTGDHSREVARSVLPGGEVLGIDLSCAMIEEATRRGAAGDLPVTFAVGDAQALTFDSNSFDACRTERMLCHVPDPMAVLREMVRVVRPRGRVAVIEPDAAGVMIDHPDRSVTAAFTTSMTDSIRNPWVGRQLRRLFHEVGLVEIEVRPQVMEVGYGVMEPVIAHRGAWMVERELLAPDAFATWLRDLEYSNVSGTFFMGMTMFVAAGRKP